MVVTAGNENEETTEDAESTESVDSIKHDNTTEADVVLEDKEETTVEEPGELQAQ